MTLCDPVRRGGELVSKTKKQLEAGRSELQKWATAGIEPTTSCALGTNHATRPSGHSTNLSYSSHFMHIVSSPSPDPLFFFQLFVLLGPNISSSSGLFPHLSTPAFLP